MILRALYDLAQQEGLAEDLDYEPAQIRYVLMLGPGGSSATIQDRAELVPAEGKKKAEIRKPTIPVPRRSGRTSGDCAAFLVDKADYIFGWDPTGKTSPEKAAKRQALYRELLETALAKQDQGSQEAKALQALLTFTGQDLETRVQPLRTAMEACSSEKDKKELASAFFSVEYSLAGPTPLHLLAGIQKFWRTTRVATVATTTRCLVTGNTCVPVKKHDTLKGIAIGDTLGTRLISFNPPTTGSSFSSFGFKGNENASIGRNTAEAIASSLNRLLSRTPAKSDGTALSRRNVRLSADTVALFWADDNADVDWFEQFTEDPDAVEALLLAPQTGHKPAIEDPSAFHMLILSGAQGRAMVRAYGCRTTAAVAQEVRRYLSQVRILRPYKGEGVYPLRVYLRSLATLGDEKNLPPQLAGDLYMAILEGRAFPRIVLDAALRRARLEAPRMNDSDPRKRAEANEAFAARCGLIRAYFHRIPQNPKEVSVSLDSECRETGYVLGRLFAVLDKAQSLAIPGANATIVDRFYGTASTAPASVFPTLLRKGQQHFGKLRGDKERPWALKLVDKPFSQITELIEAVPFPKTLDLDSQGLFALGFHHQRQAFFNTKNESSNN